MIKAKLIKNSLNTYTKDLIVNSFELEAADGILEAQLELILAERVEYLLANQLEFFFAAMYRMDVEESKIHQALGDRNIKPSLKIARLIIQRQKEKQASREKYRSDSNFFDDSF